MSFSTRKKVTFDSNVRTYEHVSTNEASDVLPESEESGKKEKEEKLSLSKSSSEDSSSLRAWVLTLQTIGTRISGTVMMRMKNCHLGIVILMMRTTTTMMLMGRLSMKIKSLNQRDELF